MEIMKTVRQQHGNQDYGTNMVIVQDIMEIKTMPYHGHTSNAQVQLFRY
jgi:hypothetical protein